MAQLVSEQEVKFYDIVVQDWPGEIDFYRSYVQDVKARHGSVLEVACGTGRVALKLANEGLEVVGLEYSPDMLAAARSKSEGLPNIRWVQGDMQNFSLDERFDLIIIPGHSFQFMLTPQEQVDCLTCIGRHLKPDGKLIIHVDHDDPGWLGDLARGKGTDSELVGEYPLESGEGSVRKWTAWSYEPATQTASAVSATEIVDKDGVVVERKEAAKKHLHCIFRFEMEHLLARAGYEIDALFGDFYRHDLENSSPDMIWVAHPEQ